MKRCIIQYFNERFSRSQRWTLVFTFQEINNTEAAGFWALRGCSIFFLHNERWFQGHICSKLNNWIRYCKLGLNYSSRVVKNKSFFFTIGVTAHLIGQASEAPFAPEFLWQAGTPENSPLQTCQDRHRHDWTLHSFTLDHSDLTQEPTDTTSCNKHLLLYAASFNYAAPSDLWLCLRLGSAQLSTADSKVARCLRARYLQHLELPARPVELPSARFQDNCRKPKHIFFKNILNKSRDLMQLKYK